MQYTFKFIFPDNEMFASASLDGTVKLWKIDDITDYTCLTDESNPE